MQNNQSTVRFNPFKVNIKAVVRETLTNKKSDIDYSFNIKSANNYKSKTEIIYQDESLKNSYSNTNYGDNKNTLLDNLNKLNLKSNLQDDTYLEGKLDLNQYLVSNPSNNFIIRVKGDSMSKIGINTGDLLIVDRTAKVTNNKIVVAAINDELLVKRIKFIDNKIQLLSENDQYQPISIRKEDNFDIWGVVKSVIKTM